MVYLRHINTSKLLWEAYASQALSFPHYCPVCGVYHTVMFPRQTPEHNTQIKSTGLVPNMQPIVTAPHIEPQGQDGDGGNANIHSDGSVMVAVGTVHFYALC